MSGPSINKYGDVVSSNLNTEGFGHSDHSLYGEMKLLRGQIIEVYPKDDSQNDASGPGSLTLYDVQVWLPEGSTEKIRRCRMLQPGFGGSLNNFFEVIPVDPGPDAKDAETASTIKRGSHVLVGFVSGQKNSGVILGCLPHPSDIAETNRPTTADGVTLKGEFQGFQFQITNEGALEIAFNGPRDDDGNFVGEDGPTTVEIDQTGNVRVKTNENQMFEINKDEKTITMQNGENDDCIWTMEQDTKKITFKCDTFETTTQKDVTFEVTGKTKIHSKDEVTVSSDTMIKLQKGDNDPGEPFVLGKKFVQFMKDFFQAYLAHQHIGNLGAPTPLDPKSIADVNQLNSSPIGDEQILSKHIKGT